MRYESKAKKIIKTIIYSLILVLLPLIIGIPLRFAYDRRVILETIIVIFGLLELLVISIMYQIKSRRLYKDKMSNSEFKMTDGYKKYKYVIYLFLFTAIYNFIESLFYFLIFE